jgi:type II secretory pathway component PulC
MYKNIIWVIIVIILGTVIFSLNKKVVEITTTPTPINTNSQSAIEKQCKNSNGEWVRAGISQEFTCIHKYSDAGKTCTSSNQCLSSYCVGEIKNKAIIGTCKKDDSLFACHQTIEDARIGKPIACVD